MISQPISSPPILGELRVEYRQGIGGYILLLGLFAALFAGATWLALMQTSPSWAEAALFGDTSALAKRYLSEQGSAWVSALCDPQGYGAPVARPA